MSTKTEAYDRECAVISCSRYINLTTKHLSLIQFQFKKKNKVYTKRCTAGRFFHLVM